MRIHFLAVEMSDRTGGYIYDSCLYNKIIERFGQENVRLYDYEFFGDEYAFLRRDFLQRGMSIRKHLDEILDCDYLVLNTTMYQKFLMFPWRKVEKSRCRMIGITHHLDYMNYADWSRNLRRRLLIKLMRHCDRLITPNPYTLDCLKEFDLAERTTLLEAYLDNTVHAPVAEKKNIISFLGTVEPRKGVDLGIRAFKQFADSHPDYEFHVAGAFKSDYSDYGYCDRLQELTEELEIADRVKFLGRIDDDAKRQLFAESRVFLFPSQLEGYGWVMVEAMSYGLPVVAFDNTAMPYTVNDSNGMLVPNRDVDAMAQALNLLADDEELYRRKCAGALQTVESLPDRETIDRQYRDFMDQMEAAGGNINA